jgi:hypothetical protein
VDSTVGGVKAALNRGRSKLAVRPTEAASVRVKTDEDAALLRLYVDRFNQRDWAGLQELIAADARLQVADRFIGRLVESPYFRNYESLPVSWRLTAGEVDGEDGRRQSPSHDRWLDSQSRRPSAGDRRSDYQHHRLLALPVGALVSVDLHRRPPS